MLVGMHTLQIVFALILILCVSNPMCDSRAAPAMLLDTGCVALSSVNEQFKGGLKIKQWG
jgi:hypothetical protein